MNENRIIDHKLITIPRYDDRFSYIYSVLVHQYALDRKAFEYFQNIQKQIEDMGGLFAPQPTEIKGNITCLTHPEEIVIGYINACRKQPAVYISTRMNLQKWGTFMIAGRLKISY